MPFQTTEEGIRYYAFESFEGVIHAVFTRRGGVSPAPWSMLNVGSTVGDPLEHVAENRRRSFHAVGRRVETLYDVWQVHSAEVVCADSPRPLHVPHLQADAMLTDRPEVTLFMRFADCVPVLLHDPVRRVVGLVHAGWQGTVQRISQSAVEAMRARYGSRPEDVHAAIGPSIAAHHYQIGPEVAARVESVFGEEAAGLLPEMGGGVHFDLWQANRLTLEAAGVHRIEIAGLCTACALEDWYSHRGEQGRTGRFGALVALRNGKTGS